jgi:hypothetical protein
VVSAAAWLGSDPSRLTANSPAREAQAHRAPGPPRPGVGGTETAQHDPAPEAVGVHSPGRRADATCR